MKPSASDREMRVRRRARRLGAALGLTAVTVLACSNPDRTLLAGLSPSEQETFRRGRS